MGHIIGYAALRDAFNQARASSDSDFDFAEKSTSFAGIGVKQLHIHWRGGEEYLRLDVLLESLRQAGNVVGFEYRGHGVEETPCLIAEVDYSGERFQLIYHLASGTRKRA